MDTQQVLKVVQDHVTAGSVKSIDDHLEVHAPKLAELSTTTPVADSGFAHAYAIARPVLVFIQGFLFFKPAWAQAVKALVAGIDVFLAAQTTESETPGL